MPILASLGAGSIGSYRMFRGASGPSYWIGLLGGSSNVFGVGVSVDSSGNVYLCGNSNASGAGDYDFQIAKYDPSGVIQWQRTLGGSGIDYVAGIAVDSSENIYVGGSIDDSGNFNSRNIQIAKYNSSGIIQWQRKFGDGFSETGGSIAVDSSGNVYFCGTTQIGAGNNDFIIAKYDTSGTIQWQRQLGGSLNETGNSIAVDGSGNVYIVGYSTTAGGFNYFIAKYDTSGTIQWQRALGQTAGPQGTGISVDSSGNAYFTGFLTVGVTDLGIVKYDTSGILQWQRRLGGVGGNGTSGSATAVDSSGNVYVIGRVEQSSIYNFVIAKYNSSGTIQWQRRLGTSSASDEGSDIIVDSFGNMYICGYTNIRGGYDLLFAKLPSDGTLTGTYTVGGYSIFYESISLTDQTSSLTDLNPSLTSSTSSYTSATSSLSNSTSTLTSSVTKI